ncbi:hypothetical protein ACFW2Y_18750 [Streptomyces sp. NPDC058877]|uniref:hypothetical protein n=1 Tax=Streptomyces sp. NPDC058877 TaxID=3346665 RepID=UPI0036A2DB10
MPAPSTAAGQTSAAPTPAVGAPRGRRRAPAASPASGAEPAPETATETETETAEQAGDIVRWAAFCCVLVPVVLLAYGTSLGGAAGTALGLVSVTATCRLLLRRSERGLRAETVRSGHRN